MRQGRQVGHGTGLAMGEVNVHIACAWSSSAISWSVLLFRGLIHYLQTQQLLLLEEVYYLNGLPHQG